MYTHLIAQLDDLGTSAVQSSVYPTGNELFGALAGIMIFAWMVGLVALGIWIWALVDVIRRQFANPNDKNLWLILVIVGLFIGNPIIPIIYLIVGRKKGTIPGSGQTPPTQTPPADNSPTQTPPAA